jgi:hypothetical protein
MKKIPPGSQAKATKKQKCSGPNLKNKLKGT